VGVAVSLLGIIDVIACVNARGVESHESDREECFGDAAKEAVVSLGIILEPAVDSNHSKADRNVERIRRGLLKLSGGADSISSEGFLRER
jgi:hypothetical protein